MLRFAALNDSETSEEDDEGTHQVDDRPKTTTKEAQETEALSLYNKALMLLKEGLLQKAQNAFLELLEIGLIKEAEPKEDDSGNADQTPALVLKYSCYKNLASLAVKENQLDEAMEYYLQAVSVDARDVTVWHKIGKLALQLEHFALAKHAFEQGLQCNSSYWPCLDQVITLLYAMNNYEVCLWYISKALCKDPGYLKGLVFLHQIFSEQRSLRTATMDLFSACDQSIYSVELEEEEKEEFLAEAREIRQKRSEASQLPPVPVLKLQRPLSSITWKSLGESLFCMYDYVNQQVNDRTDVSFETSRVTFGCRVDLSTALDIDSSAVTTEPSQAEISILPPIPSTPVSTQTSEPMETPSQKQETEKIEDPMETDQSSRSSRSQPAKRGAKRKRLHLDDDPFGVKRRSTRVRNTVKKKEEMINYQELLKKFLPQNLLECSEDLNEDSLPSEPLDLTTPSCRVRLACSSVPGLAEATQLSAEEESDVRAFINEHQVNSGILDLLNEYLVWLARRREHRWTADLPEVYLQCYERLRKHIEYPDFLCKDVTDDRLRDMAMVGLMWVELKLDQWMVHSPKATPPAHSSQGSPRKSPIAPSVSYGQDFLTPYFPKDLHYLVALSVWGDVLREKATEFTLRVFWVKARFNVLLNKKDLAGESFLKVCEILKESSAGDASDASPLMVHLVNCTVENLITLDEVQKQEEALKRCQSLEEVQRLHESGDHAAVVETLLQTFTQSSTLRRTGDLTGCPERHAQLLLLQDSLLELTDYRRCLVWGEVSFNEALQKFLSAPTSEEKDEWIATMIQLFQGLEKCLAEDHNIINNVPARHLVRLVHNLIRTIEFSMDVPEGATDMAISSVLPWMLLFRLIDHEEEKVRKLQLDQSSDVPDVDICLPSSILLLNVAHESLGRRGWCMHTNGILLLFMVDAICRELQKSSGEDAPHPFRENLYSMLEQCFYCLYGHPNKKTKARHLTDHNVDQIVLTWDRCLPLFDHFKPKSMPEFDSYKTSTVSGDLENLLRRISALVPSESAVLTVEQIQSYIDDTILEPPSIPEGRESKLPIVNELYYLLADYYFKNKEQTKAIKFYLLDLCYNPQRFDSWAGMALARASRLEQKLSSHELKPEWPTQKQAVSTLRCFQRALQLDSSNSKLWIEYGALAYTLHSHASRLLKQEKLFPLTEEIRVTAQSNVKEMLALAKSCYLKVGPLNMDDSQGEGDLKEEEYIEETEEKWLQHYMLGKVAEKNEADPAVFLKHYLKGLYYLYEDYAKYPKKITYYYSAPYLAVESLELFYRIHACVCKCLLKYSNNIKEWPPSGPAPFGEIPFNLLEKYIKAANESPFAKCQEKKVATQREDAEKSDADSQLEFAVPSTSTTKRPKTLTKTLPDHNYSKNKISSESSEQSSQESLDTSQESAVFKGLSPRATPTSFFSPTFGKPRLPSTPNIAGVSISTPSVVDTPPEKKKISSFSMEAILGDVVDKGVIQELKSSQEPASQESAQEEKNDPPLLSINSNLSLAALDLSFPCSLSKTTSEPIQKPTSTLPLRKSGSEMPVSDPSQAPPTLEKIDDKPPEEVKGQEGGNNEKADVKMETDQDEAKGEAAKVELKPLDDVSRFEALMKVCIEGFMLCVSRFPQHYKSLYRLAHIYFHSISHKNIKFAQDVLLGNPKWAELEHMSSPGLFQDRKATNFFNGLWHIPIEDIDRSGAFPTHLFKALVLLFEVLLENHNHSMLLHIHHQLMRTPDPGKKYIRDLDRVHLAKKAFVLCVDAMERAVKQMAPSGESSLESEASQSKAESIGSEKTEAENSASMDVAKKSPGKEDRSLKLLLGVHKAWQYGMKNSMETDRLNQLFKEAFVVYNKGQVDPQGNVIERAARFCQQQTQTSKTPTTPSADKGPTVPAFPQAKAKAAESGEKLSEKKSEEIPSTQPLLLSGLAADLGGAPNLPEPRPKKVIWTGVLEWTDKARVAGGEKVTHTLPCHIYVHGEIYFDASKWPPKLSMQLFTNVALQPVSHLLRKSRFVHFDFPDRTLEAMRNLSQYLHKGWGGCLCVPTVPGCDVKLMLLIHSKQRFTALVPRDQSAFVSGIRSITHKAKAKASPMRSQVGKASARPSPANPAKSSGSPRSEAAVKSIMASILKDKSPSSQPRADAAHPSTSAKPKPAPQRVRDTHVHKPTPSKPLPKPAPKSSPSQTSYASYGDLSSAMLAAQAMYLSSPELASLASADYQTLSQLYNLSVLEGLSGAMDPSALWAASLAQSSLYSSALQAQMLGSAHTNPRPHLPTTSRASPSTVSRAAEAEPSRRAEPVQRQKPDVIVLSESDED